MIANEAELQQTQEYLAGIEEALATLKGEIYPHSLERFAVMAEAYVDEIARLRAEIDEYTGMKMVLQSAKYQPAETGVEAR